MRQQTSDQPRFRVTGSSPIFAVGAEVIGVRQGDGALLVHGQQSNGRCGTNPIEVDRVQPLNEAAERMLAARPSAEDRRAA